ncbi:response regulator [Devriesea agamarum]|uniref:response regulator n=1 Tax=Devriesea agamarum TaxID=472569 RepID=UPI00071C954A|nr:response regulator transcription factor [Devriesea agamarum]
MRIVIADDSALLREGLRLLLEEAGHDVVDVADDGPGLVNAALHHRPDLVVTDIRMPPTHTDEGLRSAQAIRAAWPEAPIILLSQYVIISYAADLLASGHGATGYLLKDRVSDIGSFLDAVERVAEGGFVMDPEIVGQVIASKRHSPLDDLTPREREVLELMAEGLTNARIAERLVITEGTVEKYSQRLFAKLGLSDETTVHRRVKAVLTLLQG